MFISAFILEMKRLKLVNHNVVMLCDLRDKKSALSIKMNLLSNYIVLIVHFLGVVPLAPIQNFCICPFS